VHRATLASPGSARVELPWSADLPLLILYMDQCAVQVSAMNFLINAKKAVILVFEDLYHREWNDVKKVCRAVPKFWRTTLQLKVGVLVSTWLFSGRHTPNG
jgi:hypothetical protein